MPTDALITSFGLLSADQAQTKVQQYKVYEHDERVNEFIAMVMP